MKNACFIFVFALQFAFAWQALGQDKKPVKDTIKIQGDIKTTIEYYAEDSIVADVLTNVIYLYGKAKIKYGDISLTATQIEIDQKTNTVTARGMPDSLGRLRGVPIFTQGNDKYEADSMKYNFKSEKGIIRGIVTQQGEGYVSSNIAKKGEDGEMFAQYSKYTTCNLKHPHWYINASKIKMIPDKQIVSGPFNLVIADIPTPLGFAFGIFPFTENQRSGIIIPTYGESKDRGFFLRQGGYFWNISDYITATFLGEIYTNGSWGGNFILDYRDRYKFSGAFDLRFNQLFQGEENERTKAEDFWLRWNHNPVTRGKSSFSASVNFGTQRFNQRREFNLQNQISNNFSSSVNYNSNFNIGETPVTYGLSARQDQNSQTGVMNVTLPDFNLAVNRIYPFKKKDETAKNFIQKINLAYSVNGSVRLSNQGVSSSSFPFKVANREIFLDEEGKETTTAPVEDFNLANFSSIARKAQIGAIHNIPITTTLKLLNYISLNPSANFQMAWYPQRLNYTWVESAKAVRVDTLKKFSNVYSFNTSLALTTRIYGTFIFNRKNKDARIQAIRHVITPNISLGYTPNLSGEKYGFYQNIQIDSTGRRQAISRYTGFQPGAPISTNESGVIGFGLQNNFEMKIKPKGDTAKAKKISLLDNLSFAGSYSLVADSLNLSNISMNARTRILNVIDFNFTGILDPYQYQLTRNTDGSTSQRRINKFYLTEGRGIGQLSNFNISVGASLTPDSFKKQTENKINQAKDALGAIKDPVERNTTERQLEAIQQNPEMYVDFDIPWTLSMSYNVSYTKQGFDESRVTQQISFNGNISLTKTWKIGFNSGFDISAKSLSTTNLNIMKDLHCWEMRFDWNPFGAYQFYSFTLGIKSSLLKDLKIQRNRSFYDRNF